MKLESTTVAGTLMSCLWIGEEWRWIRRGRLRILREVRDGKGYYFRPTAFGIFDAFPDEDGRQAHLSGSVAAALMEKAGELFLFPTLTKLLSKILVAP
ncbi:MAG TPA: hypothetical protein VGJ66_04465 [Pyrinomonadaceae bacterium]